MKPTPIYTKVYDDHTFHFFLEPVEDILNWSNDSKVSVMSLTDQFAGSCGNSIPCRSCPFYNLGDCEDISVYATILPELVQLYPEYFI